MARSILLNFLYSLLGCMSFANGARILALFPVPAKSHFTYNEAVMKSLHAAGHHITLVSPFSSEDKIHNYTMIDSRSENKFIYVGQTPVHYYGDMSLMTHYRVLAEICEPFCYDIMKLKEIQDALNSADKLYDVMFTELFLVFPACYLPIAKKLGIPVIGTITLRTWNLEDGANGIPNNPAIIPHEIMDIMSSRMTFTERLKNVWAHFVTYYFEYYDFPARVDQFYRKYFTGFESQSQQISLIFYNNHASVFSRLTVPNFVEVGGVHIQPAKPLPSDLKIFIDEAKAGVILFTLGSFVNTSSMSATERNAFVNAFALIPQRVIWKFEKPIEGISNNVLLSSWVPQRDILAHHNVKAFISHCGLSGTYEAIHTGTPVIMVPLLADQWSNAAVLEDLGVGVHLDLKTITTNAVLDALNTIINDTRYYDRMQNLSRTFKDRPMTPQQSIVYWTEYVIRHHGAPHLRAVGSEMPFYQYFLLDIIFILIVTVTATWCTVAYVSKILYKVVVKHFRYLKPIEKEKKIH